MDKEHRSILFVDVCDSTKLMQSLGDERGRAVLVACFGVLRKNADEFGGSVLDNIGDELMISFADPVSAARGACAMHASVADAGTSGVLPPGVCVRVGFHHGPVVISDGGIFGKTIHLAKRVASASKAQQIVTSKQTLDLLPASAGIPSRFLDRAHVKGQDEALEMHELLWDLALGTVMEAVTEPASRSEPMTRLIVTHRDSTREIGPTRPVLTVGRDAHCDMVIEHPKVSRLHGRFEFRKHGYVFVDASANGSHVVLGSDPKFMRREEARLLGDGAVLLGASDSETPRLEFSIREGSTE